MNVKMTNTIKLNPSNLNLKNACYYYPCHKNISDLEYDCRCCYCQLYTECSKLNNTLWGGYWLKYFDKNNKLKKVFACEKCTFMHQKQNVDYYLKLKDKGLSNNIILNELIQWYTL